MNAGRVDNPYIQLLIGDVEIPAATRELARSEKELAVGKAAADIAAVFVQAPAVRRAIGTQDFAALEAEVAAVLRDALFCQRVRYGSWLSTELLALTKQSSVGGLSSTTGSIGTAAAKQVVEALHAKLRRDGTPPVPPAPPQRRQGW